MDLEEYHTLFVVVSLILILVATVPVIGMIMPRREEPFFALGLLGEGGMLEDYYPGDDPDIGVGSLVRWYAVVYNHMGCAQYVAVRVKVLNSTLPSPDSLNCTPSPVPAFFEFRHILVRNETWVFPFFWYIAEAAYQGDSVVIAQLVVNNATLNLNAKALFGFNFRIVLELWFYDAATQSFEFASKSGEEYSCKWNQIWFNATLAE